jgi:Astacin (Peptidase family M12A)
MLSIRSISQFVLLTALLLSPVLLTAQTTKPVYRDQAVLMVDGEFGQDGLKVKTQPLSGPGASMSRTENGKKVSGSLDPGDIVTAVEGKGFKDKREFLDLMDEAYRVNKGVLRITVKDVNSGKSFDWTVRPDLIAKYELPPKEKVLGGDQVCVAAAPKLRKGKGGSSGLSLVADEKLLWTKNELKVYFLSGDEALHKKVMKYANAWSEWCDIKFVQIAYPEAGPDISIAFNTEGHKNGNWSVIGTDSTSSTPSMNLETAASKSASEEQIRRVVLHEFGHALGFIHEHQSPRAGIRWNEKATYEYYTKLGLKVDKQKGIDEVKSNILDPHTSSGILNSTEFDSKSVMLYYIPAEVTRDGVAIGAWNNELSELDKKHAAWLYPKDVDSSIRPHGSRLRDTPVPHGHRFLIQIASNFDLSKNGEYTLSVFNGKDRVHHETVSAGTLGKTWTWYNDTGRDVVMSYSVCYKGKGRQDLWRFCSESEEFASKGREGRDEGPNREDRRSLGVPSKYHWYSGAGDTVAKDNKRPIQVSRQVDKMEKK